MSDNREMVFSACVTWLNDWLEAEAPILNDEWDLSNWMDCEMKEAVQTFLTFGFKTSKARSDALIILRALFYEYYLFQKQTSITRISINQTAVDTLPKLAQSVQKSAEWHAESREMLSGHEFGPVCMGSRSERLHVMMKKCTPEIVAGQVQNQSQGPSESRTVFLTSEDGKLSAFKWGWRYEPVARMVYEQYISDLDGSTCTVYDGLGRIRHPTLPRLGASPDGLIMTGSRKGRLLEIKCPISRKLDNKVPVHYYCQMQLQAETCNVDAVEYIEIQFSALPQEKINDTVLSGCRPWIGKVCVCAVNITDSPSEHTYQYSPLYKNTKEDLRLCLEWTPPGIVLESSIWFIKDWFHTTVLRNPRWWNAVGYPSYMDFWKDVEMARTDGRFKPCSQFVDSCSEASGMCEIVEEQGEIDHGSNDTATVSDDLTNEYMNDDDAKPSGVWQGVE